jgi:hypothetical protein
MLIFCKRSFPSDSLSYHLTTAIYRERMLFKQGLRNGRLVALNGLG